MTASSAPIVLPDVHMTPGGPFGIYVHVPFCFTRCGYCDFNTYTPAELGGVNPDAWLQVLRSELELAAARLGAPIVHTVFVGGGTPSLLGGERLATVLESVREHFALAPDAEITTEANSKLSRTDCSTRASRSPPNSDGVPPPMKTVCTSGVPSRAAANSSSDRSTCNHASGLTPPSSAGV